MIPAGTSSDHSHDPRTLCVISEFRRPSGLAHVAAAIADNLGSWGHTVHRIEEEELAGGPQGDTARAIEDADILVVALSHAGTDLALRSIGAHRLDGKHIVANWWWEVGTWQPPKGLDDEIHAIWTGSPFVTQIMRPASKNPVATLPLLWGPVGTARTVAAKTPRFALCFDFRSMMARKNPDGAVRAFIEAFPEPGEAHLLVKSYHASERPAESRRLKDAIAGRPDIEWVDAEWDTPRMERFYEDLDVLVSLHRGEALGLPIVEAQRRGKAVIATRWGGAAHLLGPTDHAIDFRLVPVGPGNPPFAADSLWAEPDHDEAVAAFRAAAARIKRRHRIEPRDVCLCEGDPAKVFAGMVQDLGAKPRPIHLPRRTPRLVLRAIIFRLRLERPARWALGRLRAARRRFRPSPPAP